jgi:hypothetical protein
MQNQNRDQALDKDAPAEPRGKVPGEEQASSPAAGSQSSENTKPGIGNLERNPKPASHHPMARA